MASGDTRLIKNAAARVYGQGIDWATGEVLTGGLGSLAGLATISKDGAAFASTGVTATEIGTTGFFSVDITAAEFTSNLTVLKTEISGVADFVRVLEPEPACDSGVLQAGVQGGGTLRSGASAVDSFYNGLEIEIVRGTGAGQTRTITTYVGSTKVFTVDRDWGTTPSTDSVYKIYYRSPAQGAAAVANANILYWNAVGVSAAGALFFNAFTHSSIVDTAPTVNSFKGNTSLMSATNDFYNRQLIIFTSGALSGAPARIITAYSGSTRLMTVYPPFPTAPSNGDLFLITGYVPG